MIEMGIFISIIFLMVFAFCGWLAYQGVVQGDPAAIFVGVCGGAGFGIILLAELRENPAKFITAFFAVVVAIVIAYPIAYEITDGMVI